VLVMPVASILPIFRYCLYCLLTSCQLSL
jgi:hypothetical protein